MKKNDDFFDLFDDVLSEIGEKVDKTVNNSKGKKKLSKDKNKFQDNRNFKTKNKNSLEGQSMMTDSLEGYGLEGQSMMTDSLEGKSQMNYSLEGENRDNRIYNNNENIIIKNKKISKFLNINSKDDLKRGIVLSEILGKPKSLRD